MHRPRARKLGTSKIHNFTQAFGHDAQAVVKPSSLKIAQPFMAGYIATQFSESRQGRQNIFFRP
jgi:hypothetical protein